MVGLSIALAKLSQFLENINQRMFGQLKLSFIGKLAAIYCYKLAAIYCAKLQNYIGNQVQDHQVQDHQVQTTR